MKAWLALVKNFNFSKLELIFFPSVIKLDYTFRYILLISFLNQSPGLQPNCESSHSDISIGNIGNPYTYSYTYPYTYSYLDLDPSTLS